MAGWNASLLHLLGGCTAEDVIFVVFSPMFSKGVSDQKVFSLGLASGMGNSVGSGMVLYGSGVVVLDVQVRASPGRNLIYRCFTGCRHPSLLLMGIPSGIILPSLKLTCMFCLMITTMIARTTMR